MARNILANLIFNRIIAHEIFVLNDNGTIKPPECSSALITTWPQKAKLRFHANISNSMGENSCCLEMDVVNTKKDSLFRIITHSIICTDDVRFIEISKAIPIRLASSQNARNIPGGVVVVFDGTVGADSKRFVGIIKAEVHEGFCKNKNGENIILDYLNSLILTPHQKLYKIALFIEKTKSTAPSRSANDFTVLVYDHNMSRGDTRKAASYFYDTFLGCTFSESDKKLVRDFYDITKTYIENMSIDDEEKIDLNLGLYSYLKVSESRTINYNEFGEQYFDSEQKEPYFEHMRVKNFPSRAINKDLSFINSILKKRSIDFTSKVKIEAPSDIFSENVKILESNDEKTTLEIKGKIFKQR